MSVCQAHACDTSAAQPDETSHASGAEPTVTLPSQGNSYRATLGRASWMLMHEMSNNLACASDLPAFYTTVRGIVALYPCAACRENAGRIIGAAPFGGPQPLPESDEEARRVARLYVNRLHAAVTESVARTGGYVSERSAEYARLYLKH